MLLIGDSTKCTLDVWQDSVSFPCVIATGIGSSWSSIIWNKSSSDVTTSATRHIPVRFSIFTTYRDRPIEQQRLPPRHMRMRERGSMADQSSTQKRTAWSLSVVSETEANIGSARRTASWLTATTLSRQLASSSWRQHRGTCPDVHLVTVVTWQLSMRFHAAESYYTAVTSNHADHVVIVVSMTILTTFMLCCCCCRCFYNCRKVRVILAKRIAFDFSVSLSNFWVFNTFFIFVLSYVEN